MNQTQQDLIAGILLGGSAEIEAVRQRVARLAIENASILVTGPSGSGKECVARALHLASARSGGPFVAVNCGAIPRELIESELFGHERGAFTGANAARAGRFEQAHGGTLFLDEIGDMPLDMQVKLLRVLEERAVERVGGTRSIPVDVRIVSATHRDLEGSIGNGGFREDLYYRLAVVPIHVPGLATRREDIVILLNHFMARSASSRSLPQFSPEGLTFLHNHPWPGNVRELRNVAERAAILHPGEILGAAELRALITLVPSANAEPKVIVLPAKPAFDLNAEVARIETVYIRQALTRSGGVVAAAARALGLRRTTLIEKMRRYDLVRDVDHASAIGATISIAL